MKQTPDVVKIVRQWVQKAEHDLKNAEHTLTLDNEECPFDTVCFHAHQCVEKYLKALLTFHRKDFPRTHDLTELAVLLPSTVVRQIPADDFPELNPYAVEARYPGDWELLSREDADHALEIARGVREIALKRLRKSLSDDHKTKAENTDKS